VDEPVSCRDSLQRASRLTRLAGSESGYTLRVATTSAPKCPQCKSPLTLHESLARRRKDSDPVKVIIPQRQWICSSETCMYTANHHVHAARR
jgi:hypothetical protein